MSIKVKVEDNIEKPHPAQNGTYAFADDFGNWEYQGQGMYSQVENAAKRDWSFFYKARYGEIVLITANTHKDNSIMSNNEIPLTGLEVSRNITRRILEDASAMIDAHFEKDYAKRNPHLLASVASIQAQVYSSIGEQTEV